MCKLLVAFGTEHVVFLTKFVLESLIDDVPEWVQEQEQRHEYRVHQEHQQAVESAFETEVWDNGKTAQDNYQYAFWNMPRTEWHVDV